MFYPNVYIIAYLYQNVNSLTGLVQNSLKTPIKQQNMWLSLVYKIAQARLSILIG